MPEAACCPFSPSFNVKETNKSNTRRNKLMFYLQIAAEMIHPSTREALGSWAGTRESAGGRCPQGPRLACNTLTALLGGLEPTPPSLTSSWVRLGQSRCQEGGLPKAPAEWRAAGWQDKWRCGEDTQKCIHTVTEHAGTVTPCY